jgi:hypothetical protein
MNVNISENGLDELDIGLSDFEKQLEENIEEAGRKAAQLIFDKSQDLVPVDDGTLKRSGEIKMEGDKFVVRYTADYAIYVHERVEMNFENGQAKFLEDSLRIELENVEDIIDEALEDAIKKI